jgi:hypothetical protein
MRSWRHKSGIAFMLAALVVSFAALWLKAPYRFEAANQFAKVFVQHLELRQLQQAHDMTFKNTLVGKTLPVFEKTAAKQLCGRGLKPIYYPTPQTNGNRLRRRLRGVAPDIDEMHVEFEQGACLFKVTLRPVGAGQWKVYNFQSHAG